MKRPFQELLQYYGMEWFLYRLSRSPHSSLFVLKGALMLRVWNAPAARPTRDIDLLGHLENSPENLARVVRGVCVVEVEPDGLEFRPATVRAEKIKEDADYEGVRVRFTGFLAKAKVPMQIDVGFGDVTIPPPGEIVYPSLLGQPAPRLKGYSRESVIAEKFEAMVKLGTLNSRMKDFYDVWHMARTFNFDGSVLAGAVMATFRNRGTVLEPEPVALTPAFSESASPQSLWRAFRSRLQLTIAPERFAEVVIGVREFLLPVAAGCMTDQTFRRAWSPPGPWR